MILKVVSKGTGEVWQEIEVCFLVHCAILSGFCSTAQVLQCRGLPQKLAPATAAASPDPRFCSAVQVPSSVLHSYITDGFTSTQLLQCPVVSSTQQPEASLGMPLWWCKVREQFTRLFSLLIATEEFRAPKTTLTSYTNCKSVRGSPRPPSDMIIHKKYSQNSLKAVKLTTMAYCNKRIQIRSAKGRDTWGRFQESSKHRYSRVLS